MRKVLIPFNEYPECNFIGSIIGPRGGTLKRLESELNAKIAIRGNAALASNDPLNVHITAENSTLV